MNTLAIHVAMEVYHLLETKLTRWEELNNESVYDITGGSGAWEREHIVLDAAAAVDYDAILKAQPNAMALEIVYEVSDKLAQAFCEQFDEYAGFDSDNAANVINHAVKHGLLRV